MLKTIRLIGGTQHGNTQRITDGTRSLRLVSMEPKRVDWIDNPPAAFVPNDNIEVYERRQLRWNGVDIEFFVHDRLNEKQIARALADLIEGVQR